VERYDAPEKLVEILVGRYGTRAPDILAQPTLVSPTGFWSVTSYTPEEIDFLAKMEDIVHLDDLILRRTMIGKLGLLNDAGLLELAEITAGAKGWSDEFKREEIRRARRLLREQHAVVLEDTAER
jgi:glycerol-3-phosphate dehydrogenase